MEGPRPLLPPSDDEDARCGDRPRISGHRGGGHLDLVEPTFVETELLTDGTATSPDVTRTAKAITSGAATSLGHVDRRSVYFDRFPCLAVVGVVVCIWRGRYG
jgi:hypothetical protein